MDTGPQGESVSHLSLLAFGIGQAGACPTAGARAAIRPRALELASGVETSPCDLLPSFLGLGWWSLGGYGGIGLVDVVVWRMSLPHRDTRKRRWSSICTLCGVSARCASVDGVWR